MFLFLLLGLQAEHVRAQVFSFEFFSDPVSEGWPLFQQYCEPQTWNDQGEYHQQLDFEACGGPPPPGGGQDEYLKDINMNGVATWFYELRVWTDGDRSEIPGNAPTALTAFNFFGESYKVNVARDQVKLLIDSPLVVVFFDVAPDVPHTVRLELNNVGTPTYRWFIDGIVVYEGVAQDVFPSDDARITWRGKAWFLPSENAWDYIRYGVIPDAASGDFDSESGVTLSDYYFFNECAANSSPGVDAGPGCRWADMDGDTDVDLIDFGLWQVAFTGG